ncbi:hypothetical protein DERF_003927 [Dermatophagoides farinae]|uniref:Uncharacterized protein n=1 Tax=Dermatophagoides farinae TaxID=6954 RepID=A0A922LBW5_DERFA|nr:hypothetical protein DERF_003927 [Dermatophagoides farinae]
MSLSSVNLCESNLVWISFALYYDDDDDRSSTFVVMTTESARKKKKSQLDYVDLFVSRFTSQQQKCDNIIIYR